MNEVVWLLGVQLTLFHLEIILIDLISFKGFNRTHCLICRVSDWSVFRNACVVMKWTPVMFSLFLTFFFVLLFLMEMKLLMGFFPLIF